MTPSSPHPTVSPQRAAVLDRLRTRPAAATVGALAAEAGLHPNTVRDHLDALVELGLAVRERAPAVGRGRPAWRYAAVPAEPSAAVREYAGLAGALAGQIARTSADPRADALTAGEAWGRALASSRPATAPGIGPAVVDLLDAVGFAPRIDADADADAGPGTDAGTGNAAGGGVRRVRLTRCPFLAVAREYPQIVCTVHFGAVRGVVRELGGTPDGVALTPFAEPGCCLLELDRRGPDPADPQDRSVCDLSGLPGTAEDH